MRLTQLATFLEDRSVCRRTLLTQYFGETDPSKSSNYNCGNCDTCNNGSVAFVVDAAPLVKSMISEYQAIIQEPTAPYTPRSKGPKEKGKRAPAAPKASHYGKQVASGTIRDRLITNGALSFLETPRISIRTKTEQRAFFDYVFGKLVLMGIFLDVSSTTKLPRGMPEKGNLLPCRFMYELVKTSGPARLEVVWKHPPRGGPHRPAPLDGGADGEEEDDIVDEMSPPPKRPKRTAKANTATTPSTSLARTTSATPASMSPFSRTGKSTASKVTAAATSGAIRRHPSNMLALDDDDDDDLMYPMDEDNVRDLGGQSNGTSSAKRTSSALSFALPSSASNRTASTSSTGLRGTSTLGRPSLASTSSGNLSTSAPMPSISAPSYDVIEVDDFEDFDPDALVTTSRPTANSAASAAAPSAPPSSISSYFPRASAPSSTNSSTNASTSISPPSSQSFQRRNFVVPGMSHNASRSAIAVARELTEDDVLSEVIGFSRPVAARAAPASTSLNIDDPQKSVRSKLLTKLKKLKNDIHSEENFATSGASTVSTLFQDKVLQQLTYKLPRTVLEFSTVNGVGEKRAEKYGARFLLTIGKFCEAHPELTSLEGVDVTAAEAQSTTTAKGKATAASPAKSILGAR